MHGEYVVSKDLNNDGILDLAHSSASYGSNLGRIWSKFYLNFELDHSTL